jgi:hypothetical protein
LLDIRTYRSTPNPSLQLIDLANYQPVATASVNPPLPLRQGEIAIKNWSENEGMLPLLIAEKIVEPPHRHIPSGYVNPDATQSPAPAEPLEGEAGGGESRSNSGSEHQNSCSWRP